MSVIFEGYDRERWRMFHNIAWNQDNINVPYMMNHYNIINRIWRGILLQWKKESGVNSQDLSGPTGIIQQHFEPEEQGGIEKQEDSYWRSLKVVLN